ncbi:MAG TPA: hypothetical protein VH012_00580 [Acidimicrobiales bacterium]|nr:hypothetical protein [Acidimicrobiales bacterium]
MDASTSTTIRGVSIFSRQRKRKADVFDIALSPDGIVIQRPGRAEQHMAWERIRQWEIEERPGCVVLTLRGGGSVTPLMVKGWTLEDLETVMREATDGAAGRTEPRPVVPAAAAAPVVDPALPVTPAVEDPTEPTEPAAPAEAAEIAEAVPILEVTAPVQPRSARRQASEPPRRSRWKGLVTVALLGVLAAAVVVVLLQSAGVISWSFLGPVA